MRILFITDSLRSGGAERQLIELLKGLRNKNGYDIYLICLSRAGEEYSDSVETLGITVAYFDRKFKYDYRPIISVVRYIKNNRIDIVHTYNNLGSIVGALGARLVRKPVICSAIRDAKDKNVKFRLSKMVLAKLANILVANSNAGFTNRFRVMKPHFRVVYNGMDFNRFKDEDSKDVVSMKQDMSIDKFKHVVGMVASLSEHKDHDSFLDAAKIVLNAFPKTCFLIVGDGLRRDALSERAKLLGLENNVCFLGHRKDVEVILRTMDVFVLLSNPAYHLEGISNAVTEAMAVGVPVVASEGGGTDEIIKDGFNGILIPPRNAGAAAEAIMKLLNDPADADIMAGSAKKTVRERFGLERYVEDYITIYHELFEHSLPADTK